MNPPERAVYQQSEVILIQNNNSYYAADFIQWRLRGESAVAGSALWKHFLKILANSLKHTGRRPVRPAADDDFEIYFRSLLLYEKWSPNTKLFFKGIFKNVSNVPAIIKFLEYHFERTPLNGYMWK